MALKHWLQTNQVFDPNLLSELPKYGINDPENDLSSLSEEQWTECRTKLINDKRSEIKDAATLNRYKRKLDKIQKLWKESRKKVATNNNGPRNSETSKTKRKRSSITSSHSSKGSKSSGLFDGATKEMEDLRMENRRIRRELSSKNSDYNRLQQEFTAYKQGKEEEIKKWSLKYKARNDEYEKLLKSYKQINQRVNSKYHDQSAKDKVIEMLKSDKSSLLDDVTKMMAAENEKYNVLLDKYEELKKVNNRNLKYKAKYKRQKKRDSIMASAVLQKEDEWDHNGYDDHHHVRSITGIDLDDLEYEEYGVDPVDRDDSASESQHTDTQMRGRHKNGISSTISPVSPYDDDWDDIESTPVPAITLRKHTRGAQSAIGIEYSRPKKFKPKPRKIKPKMGSDGKSVRSNGRKRNRAQSVINHSSRSSSRSGSYTLSHVHTASMHRATVSSNRALRKIGNT